MKKWKILVVEGHTIVRVGLAQLVREYFDWEVVAEVDSAEDALETIKGKTTFDLVIIGTSIGSVDELITEIRVLSAEIQLLVFAKNMHYPYALGYLISGANGFLTHDAPVEEVVKAVMKSLNQERYLCMELLEAMAQETYLSNVHRRKISPHKGKIDTHHSLNDKLSKRQKEIVGYLIKGESLSGIATHLNIKISTVGTHKSIVFEKLGVKNVLELIEMYYGDMVV